MCILDYIDEQIDDLESIKTNLQNLGEEHLENVIDNLILEWYSIIHNDFDNNQHLEHDIDMLHYEIKKQMKYVYERLI